MQELALLQMKYYIRSFGMSPSPLTLLLSPSCSPGAQDTKLVPHGAASTAISRLPATKIRDKEGRVRRLAEDHLG